MSPRRKLVRYIPFLHLPEWGMWRYVRPKEKDISPKVVDTAKVYMVAAGELCGLTHSHDRVMCTRPALADKWTKIERYAGCPKFNFGIYLCVNNLLLLDDVIEWGDRRIIWTEIRTAWDLRR